MCDGDLMARVFVEDWDSTCAELNMFTNLEWIECNDSDMEDLRSHCCEHYGEGNLIFLSKKN